jgi:hypothetical protein
LPWCINCGAENPIGADYCYKCGNKIVKEPESRTEPQQKEEIKEQESLTESQQQSLPESVPEPVSKSVAKKNRIKFIAVFVVVAIIIVAAFAFYYPYNNALFSITFIHNHDVSMGAPHVTISVYANGEEIFYGYLGASGIAYTIPYHFTMLDSRTITITSVSSGNFNTIYDSTTLYIEPDGFYYITLDA